MKDDIYYGFTETSVFTRQLFKMADDNLLYEIQRALIANPLLGDVIQGTHGARKGRVNNPKTNKGKSGGLRFIYVFLERSERIYLIYLFPKTGPGKQADLTPEQKKAVAEQVLIIKKGYNEV